MSKQSPPDCTEHATDEIYNPPDPPEVPLPPSWPARLSCRHGYLECQVCDYDLRFDAAATNAKYRGRGD